MNQQDKNQRQMQMDNTPQAPDVLKHAPLNEEQRPCDSRLSLTLARALELARNVRLKITRGIKQKARAEAQYWQPLANDEVEPWWCDGCRMAMPAVDCDKFGFLMCSECGETFPGQYLEAAENG